MITSAVLAREGSLSRAGESSLIDREFEALVSSLLP